jgi:two-component system cell cycle sensor histidine kinase/response regulator CckA
MPESRESMLHSSDAFRAMVDTVRDAVLFIAPDLTIIYVNPAAEELYGYSPGELVGRSAMTLVPDHLQDAMRSVASPGPRDSRPRIANRRTETHGVRRDGTQFPADLSVTGSEYEGGMLYTAIVRDISARRATEDALRESEQRYRMMVETASEGVWVIDAEMRTVFVNRTMSEMFGYQVEDLLGTSPFDLFEEGVGVSAATRMERRRQGLAERYEQRLRHRDGSTVWASVSASPLMSEDGKFTGALALVTDITERRRAEDALREAEARVRTLLDATPDAVVGVDESGRILFVNAQAERFTGYPAAELVGRLSITLAPPRVRRDYVERHLRYFAEGGLSPEERDFVVLAADGTERPCEARFSTLETAEGRIAVAALRDVSERQEMEKTRAQLEARLHQAERLESVGQLAGGIAHDFNNLLGVIINYAEFVRSELEGNARLEAEVGEISRAAERAAALTHQLLVFSRRDLPERRVLDLNTLVSGARSLLERTLGSQIDVRTDLEGGVWALVGDSGQVEQVLFNLAINARDAMPEGGVLTMSTANLRLAGEEAASAGAEPGNYVRLTVSDTGTGMSHEVRTRAFDPFFTTKRKGQGTGLGLATVHGVVEQMGGYIQVRSAPGEGSTFSLILPAHRGAVAAVPAPEPPAVDDADDRTVLLVEDEPAVRRLTTRILEHGGYHVLEAGGAEEALRAWDRERDRVDLLLTDVVMPVMSGRELAERLNGTRADLPVLYMSGFPGGSLDREAVEADAGLLQKPFKAEDLLRAVRAALTESAHH